jgi:hypothetical protein
MKKPAIAVVTWGPNRLDMFGLGTDNQLYHQAWSDGVWGGWEGLGGALTSAPAVVSGGRDRADIFALGLDTGMYHQAWDGLGTRPER